MSTPTVVSTFESIDSESSVVELSVERHIHSTSRSVRNVDTALFILIALSFFAGGLFLAILADHWLLKEGLSMLQRLGVLTLLFLVTGLYLYWKIAPLIRYSINPVYAADLIEKDTPVFKNSLINWLLLRQERSERSEWQDNRINDRMYNGIVQSAAAKIQTIPAGHAVDVQRVIWAGTIFALLVVLFLAYTAFSPKNPFTSLWRVMIPFSKIERPQIAQFLNIKPGNTAALQGETLTISAEVISPSSETVYLLFSTDDGQASEQRIPMFVPQGKKAFETSFPPGKQGANRGLGSSVDYRIVQGESRSMPYRIDVLPAASIEIVSLSYQFPHYTGLKPETIRFGSDIHAIEGTEVTVFIRSTLPLQEIDLVFDHHPSSRVQMTITNPEKTEAKGTFSLKMPFPYKNFSFRATDSHGNHSRRSGIYPIEVILDRPPHVQWADTAAYLDVPQIDLPLNKALQLPIQAEDPDFALRHLTFKTESPAKRIADVPLLESPVSGPTEHRGQIKTTITFIPAEKRLVPGDSVDVFVEADDTKLPEANVSRTQKIKINVIDPEETDEFAQEEKQGKDESEQNQHQQEGGNEQSDQQEGQSQEGQGGQSQEGSPQEQNPDQGNPPQEGQSGEGQEGQGQGNQQQSNQQQSNQQQSNQQEQQSDDHQQERSGSQQGQSGQTGSSQEQNPDESQEKESRGNEGGNQRQKNENQEGQGSTSGNQASESQPPEGYPQESNSRQGAGNPQKGEEESGGGQNNAPQSSGDQQDGANTKDSNSNNTQPDDTPSNHAPSESTDGKEGTPKQNFSPNPETQDGDAMERIVDQMKKEGQFTGKNPFSQSDRQPTRDDSLDPRSPSRSHTGHDPSNPKQSSSSSQGEGSPQNQTEKQGQQENIQQQKESESDTGQAGDSPSDDSQKGGRTNSFQSNAPQGESDTQSAQENQKDQEGDQGQSDQGQGDSTGSSASEEKGAESDQRDRTKDSDEQTQGSQSPSGQTPSDQTSNGQPSGQSNTNRSSEMPKNQQNSKKTSEEQGGTQAPQSGGSGGRANGEGIDTAADDPNLEYAEKVTNLILDYLENQLKDKPNHDLLNHLGWSEEQLRQFHSKWQKMSQEKNKSPQQEGNNHAWIDALKATGLLPSQQQSTLREGSSTRRDQTRQTEAQRYEPPAFLKERARKYNEGIGK